MESERRVRDFFEAYRAAFERYDAVAIAELFAYPGHVTGDTDEIVLSLIPSRETWIEQVKRLLALYRAIDVASARVSQLDVLELSPRLLQAVVRWELNDGGGARLYDFQATYTLAEIGDALRISAIAHNEMPRYRRCVARLRGQRRGDTPGSQRGAG